MPISTTVNERNLLLDILRSDFQDGKEPVMNAVWSDDLCGTHTRAATLGSLVKKGLAGQHGKGSEAVCWLTAEGAEVIATEVAAYRLEYKL
jgi:hypothetical protein